ncbi:hypothetical protein BDZ97DRAFT_186336 [Flammula alnicola]|nr:hypothetical protein BDZ97DRAFT_186336 [Flammula alnicola]
MAQDERRESWKRSAEPITPLRPTPNGVGRSSTLRDTRRSGGPSPRWSSDDFRSPASLRDRHPNATQSTEDLIAQKERRQSLRGGSAESALLLWSPGGRSLLGEGLRAAGLSRRKEEDSRGRLTDAGPSTASGDSFRDRDRRVEWSPQDVLDEGRRRVFTQREKDRQDRQPQRASTSMAQYQYLDRDEDGRRGREGGRDLALRGHKSSYSLTTRERDASPTRRTGDPSAPRRERDSLPPERAGSSMSRFHNIQVPQHTSSPAPAMPAHLLERAATGSPFGTRRFTQSASSSTAQMQTEHTRLMIESLAMFEAQLAKLPPQLGSSTTSSSGVSSSHAELARNAQGVVYTAERLAALLKLSTARAQDAQVEAEVDTTERDRSQDILTIWNRVAADYRDGSRAADELVRGLTAVLLGVGRIMRDLGATAGTSEFGSPSVHGRHVSLSEEDIRGVSPDIRAESSASGRRSAASRHSWEPAPRDREREREEALRRLDGAPRSESVLARASPATFQKLRDREQLETPSHPSQSSLRKSTPGTGDRPASSVRRLFAPREQREQMFDAKVAPDNNDERRGPGMTTLDSQETIHGQGYEPSPTPASKTRASAASDRKRTLTPISIPKPLPILPSESLVRRQAGTSTAANNKANEGSLRDKVRQKSTIRSERPSFPSITTPSNATTALTPHTVSTTPSKTAGFPLVRTDSEKSTRSQVTFSRPVAVSVSATLSGIQQQHLDGERNRTISNASSNAEPSSSVRPDPIMRAMSGSETERDIRRKTVGTKTPRASLDSQLDERSTLTASGTRLSNVHAADRSAASTILHQSANAKRERRRTVTDIWPPE